MKEQKVHTSSVSARRYELTHQSNNQFLEQSEYLALMTSNRKLARADDSRAGLRGLKDLSSGERFLIEDEKLLNSEAIL